MNLLLSSEYNRKNINVESINSNNKEQQQEEAVKK